MKGLTLIYGRDSSLKRSQEPMDIEVASKVRSLKLNGCGLYDMTGPSLTAIPRTPQTRSQQIQWALWIAMFRKSFTLINEAREPYHYFSVMISCARVSSPV